MHINYEKQSFADFKNLCFVLLWLLYVGRLERRDIERVKEMKSNRKIGKRIDVPWLQAIRSLII